MTVTHAACLRDFGPALEALAWWLLETGGYSQHATEDIIGRVAESGELAGSVLAGVLDQADEQQATEVYIEAMPTAPFDSAAWDDETTILDARMLAAGNHPLPFGDEPDDADRSIPAGAILLPPELEPDAPDADPSIRFPGIASLAERMALPPISGGAPETYEPSPTEWAEACALFRDGEPAPFVPSPADWADYHRHFDQVEPRYGYE